jgi:5-hydroxyisourate hydrolase
MSSCSTHVLDAALGAPAAGMRVHLGGPTGPDGPTTEHAVTDADGRVRFASDLAPGVYTLTFETGEWFAAAARSTFFPVVGVMFVVEADRPHDHVALLLSPFSYTTYRGS